MRPSPPRHESPRRPGQSRVQLGLPRDVAGEIRATARPGRTKEALERTDRALSFLETGDPAAATAEAERAKALAPRSAAVREILGLALYADERWREALRELQAYRRMSGRIDENHVIADAHRALGHPERAVEDAENALAGDVPDEVKAEAAVVGASALTELGRLQEALGILRRFPTRAGRGRPFDLRVWYVTGDVLERMGRREDAALEFSKVVRHDPAAFDAADRLAALR